MFRFHYAADERSSGASKRLSERFGIPEQEVNDLLYGSAKRSAADDPLTKGGPRMPMPHESNRWNPVSVLGALLGIAGILSLVVLIMVIWHHHQREAEPFAEHEHVLAPMQAQPQPAPQPPPQPTPVQPLPNAWATNPPAQMQPPSSEEGNPAPKKKIHHTSKGYSTTSNMDAEEHLAELRADGNSHAKIHTTKKNGVVTYTVR